jgi:hypothetical protein
MQSRSEKLVRWFIFSVMVALAPLVISYLGLRLDRQQPRLYMLTMRGEVLLISTTIASAAVGEIIASGRDNALLKLMAGGSSVLLVLYSSLLFAAIQGRQAADPQAILTASLVLFAGTLLASSGCVYLAHEGEPR